MTESISLDIMGVMRLLPHRYPFLLVDRVLECIKGESIRAIKNVTINEPFFPGHFPHRPVMPGVMIIEALAQTAGCSRSSPPTSCRTIPRGSSSSASTRRASASPSSPATSSSSPPSSSVRCAASGSSPPSAYVGDDEVTSAEMMVAPETNKTSARAPQA